MQNGIIMRVWLRRRARCFLVFQVRYVILLLPFSFSGILFLSIVFKGFGYILLVSVLRLCYSPRASHSSGLLLCVFSLFTFSLQEQEFSGR